ncbi:hypothetical protein [Pelagibacterium sp.]|uniref:hypothetical protein n=1 Tax=Pelagibacterium sp. TaxID=1967288 RepID=UPI003A8F7835
MPNVKLYIDRELHKDLGSSLKSALPQIREIICSHLAIGPSACQLAVIAVDGLPDQPLANLELHILPGANRTSDKLKQLAAELQNALEPRLQVCPAVRIAQLDAETYVALIGRGGGARVSIF